MSNERIAKFDLIRSVAIISVVACHAVEKVYPFREGVFQNYSMSGQLFALTTFLLGRLGAPLFLIMTGYFLLVRNYSDEASVAIFYKTKALRLYLSTVIGIVGLNVADSLIDHVPMDGVQLIKQSLFLIYLPGVQTWYMPVIIGMYLWIPFLARGLKRSSPREISVLVIVSVVYGMLMNDISVATSLIREYPSVIRMDIGVMTSYALYVLVGWLLYNQVFRKVKPIVLWSVFVGGITILTILMFVSEYRVWYNSGILLLAGTANFELMLRVQPKGNRILTSIVKCSFGIYWVHSVIQKIIAPYIIEELSSSLATLVLWSVSFIASWLCVEVYFITKGQNKTE